jgi:hypothetical protein
VNVGVFLIDIPDATPYHIPRPGHGQKGTEMKSYRYTQNGSLMETPEPHQEEQDSKISLWIDALLLVACIVAGLLVFMAGYNVFMDMFNQLTHLFPGG